MPNLEEVVIDMLYYLFAFVCILMIYLIISTVNFNDERSYERCYENIDCHVIVQHAESSP